MPRPKSQKHSHRHKALSAAPETHALPFGPALLQGNVQKFLMQTFPYIVRAEKRREVAPHRVSFRAIQEPLRPQIPTGNQARGIHYKKSMVSDSLNQCAETRVRLCQD